MVEFYYLHCHSLELSSNIWSSLTPPAIPIPGLSHLAIAIAWSYMVRICIFFGVILFWSALICTFVCISSIIFHFVDIYIYFQKLFLIEVKFPFDPVCPSVGRSVITPKRTRSFTSMQIKALGKSFIDRLFYNLK